MSLISVTWHLIKLKTLGIRNFNSENLGTKQSVKIYSALDKNELLNALQRDPVFGKYKINENDDRISFTTKLSMSSFGEDVSIRLLSENGNRNEYEVTSKPVVKTTSVDYGRNLENILRLQKIFGNR